MLTGDLARVRTAGRFIRPVYITRREAPRYLPLCRTLIGIFRRHEGKPRRAIESAVESLEGIRIDYKVLRGLASLLEEACEFRPPRELDYPRFRERVFTLAQARYPIVSRPDLLHANTRERVLEGIASEIGCDPDAIDGLLYGDLPDNRILVSFREPTPDALLRRYNLALAQAVLYNAVRMQIHLSGDYRTVFQYLRLSRLMHRIRPSGRGYEITLDGPASLFSNTQRYGIRMSNFLPGLVLAAGWHMRADIRTPDGEKEFLLDDGSGLSSHYTPVPPFDSRLEKEFYTKFSRKKRIWTIEREGDLIVLGDQVMIPDFTFRHADGRTVSMEIVGYWTPEYLNRKMEKIRRAGPDRLIVAVNRSLNCSRDDFEGDVIFYRTGIRIRDVLDRLEKMTAGRNDSLGSGGTGVV